MAGLCYILNLNYVTSSLERGAKYCDEYFCLSAFLTVRSRNSITALQIIMHVTCETMTRSNPTALRYVMYFWFVDDVGFHTMGPLGQNHARRCFEKFARWQYQLDVRQPVIGRVHQNAAPGAKSAIYDFYSPLMPGLLWV